jgi:hypothetical protein
MPARLIPFLNATGTSRIIVQLQHHTGSTRRWVDFEQLNLCWDF